MSTSAATLLHIWVALNRKTAKNAILLKIISSSHLPLRIEEFLSILIQPEFPYIYPPQMPCPALRKLPNHYQRRWHACLNPIHLKFWRHSKLVGMTTTSGRSKSPLQNYFIYILAQIQRFGETKNRVSKYHSLFLDCKFEWDIRNFIETAHHHHEFHHTSANPSDLPGIFSWWFRDPFSDKEVWRKAYCSTIWTQSVQSLDRMDDFLSS